MKFKGDKRREIFIIDGDYCQTSITIYEENVNNIKIPMHALKFNLVALLLNVSDSSLEQAQTIYRDLESSRILIEDRGEKPFYEYPKDKHCNFIDFTEKYFTSIVFAYSAVEAYVNSLIKKDIELPNRKEELESLTINDIEQRIGLKEKIKEIIPFSRNITINTDEMPFWSDFCDLIKYRNEIAHPKSEKLTVVLNKNRDITQVKSSQIKVLNELYHDARNKDIVRSARKVIGFLASKTDYPEVTPLEFRNYEPANLMDYVRQNKINIEYED
jgi:hypothetical protein